MMPEELGRYIQNFLRPTKKELGDYKLRHHYKTICLTPDPTVTYTFIPNPAISIKYVVHLHILHFLTIEKICNGERTTVMFQYRWTILRHPNHTFSIPFYDGMLHSSMTCSNPHPLLHYYNYYSSTMTYEYFLTNEQKSLFFKE
jgi:hypothetical protein